MNGIRILFAGVGGQGIITTAVILGEAAILENKNSVMSEIHGLAQRGGMVSVEMKVGDFKSPLLEEGSADVVVGMEPSEAYRLRNKYSRESFIILNTTPLIPFTVSVGLSRYPDLNELFSTMKGNYRDLHLLNAEELAKSAGNIITASMVFAGALAATKPVEEVIGRDSIASAIKYHFPERLLKENLKAFELGYESIKSH